MRLDHNFDENWGFTAILPLINREHEQSTIIAGRSCSKPGASRSRATRAGGRYQIQGKHPANVYGMTWGLKLPTGGYSVRNRAGELAERSLQPGTGTTNAVLSLFWNDTPPIPDSGWFAQAVGDVPLYRKAGYRPGYQLLFDVGYTYHPLDELVLSLQLNTLKKGRDSGPEAEPNDSGKLVVVAQPGRQLRRHRQHVPLRLRPGADLPIRQRRSADGQMGGSCRRQHPFLRREARKTAFAPPVPDAGEFWRHLSIPAAELAVVPGEGLVRRDLEDDALRGAADGARRALGGAALPEPRQYLGDMSGSSTISHSPRTMTPFSSA